VTEQSVTFSIEAAHRSAVRSAVDHTLLNDSIGGTTMEHMAGWLLERFAFLPATKVVVRRPTLGYAVEARQPAC
jgi:hypothetical protein